MKIPAWPVVLIVAGAALLAGNLGLISFGDLRRILGTWWPLILIALGVAGLIRRER